MARQRPTRKRRSRSQPPAPPHTPVSDYRHEGTTRKNIPPAKLAAEGTVPVLPKIEYSYSPRRPPVLRFEATGKADRLPELLEEAKKRKLTAEEIALLADALRTHEPSLEWANKREHRTMAPPRYPRLRHHGRMSPRVSSSGSDSNNDWTEKRGARHYTLADCIDPA